jgi:hypothetical protein
MRNPNRKHLEYAESLRPLLTDLRWAAHNPNVIGAVPGAVMTSKREGWEFGCKVEDHGEFMRRKIFVKCLGQPLATIPEAEKDPIMAVVFDTMLDESTPATSIEILAPDCVMIVQDFVPILLQKTDRARGHIKFDDGILRDVRKGVTVQ